MAEYKSILILSNKKHLMHWRARPGRRVEVEHSTQEGVQTEVITEAEALRLFAVSVAGGYEMTGRYIFAKWVERKGEFAE